jgi:creatinine amidohydrolase
MLWENLNVREFQKAVKDSGGVCLLPMPCLEKHGDHLPLGTDYFLGRDICVRAASVEPAVVFGTYPFGQVSEVRHMIGTIALEARLQMELMQALCDEIGRSGFDKIIMVISHGGNGHMLRYFAQSQLDKRRPYVVFVHAPIPLKPEQEREINEKFGRPNGSGHADVNETSFVMAYDPSLVHMENVKPEESVCQGRLEQLDNAYTGIGWYGSYPNQFAGDPTGASPERGAAWRDAMVVNLAATIRSVKQHKQAADLQKEFFDRCDNPGV